MNKLTIKNNGSKMLKLLPIILLILTELSMAQNNDLANRLYNDYELFKEKSITQRRFKHADIIPLIKQFKDNKLFKVEKAGESAEGRNIYLITLGSGSKRIFLWSQMHGDEPTATMALFDIFNFFKAVGYDDYKQSVLNNCTIYFMPMVNPDGAEVHERRNIFDIDINRDAVRQQTPEGILLRSTFEKLKADFGFNLHDQSTGYSVGNTFKSAAISFLAPTTNFEKTVNNVQGDAMKLISELYLMLSKIIPGHVAKYTDDFEPRAFGDNFQKWGTSTILIESGGWKDDTEKQFLRKINFITLLSSFESIAKGNYNRFTSEIYDQIPLNDKYMMDVILRNLKTSMEGKEYLIDVGINQNEQNFNNSKQFYYRSSIEDLGDLSVYYGYKDLDLRGMSIEPGRILETEFNSLGEISNLNFDELHQKGYTTVRLADKFDDPFTNLPINISLTENINTKTNITMGNHPDFVIKQNGVVKYIVINGFLRDVINKTGEIKNGAVYR